MITLRRMALGAGFRYLMKSVAAGDGGADPGSGLVRYYSESGTPPGIFLGAGLAALGDGEAINRGEMVSEERLWRMLGVLADPLTGRPVGSVPRAGHKGTAVAGFDLTFSPSKSVSVAWALADARTRAVIYDCHRRAIDFVLAYAEREVFHSRSGTNGVVQEDIDGVVAVSFTHFDSRAGDPQLHDHVVVWNRARSSSDGVWRTLDSRGLFKSVVALSEMHQGVLSDYLTEALGVGWEARARRHSERPRWEITHVPEGLLAEFSQRNEQVEAEKDRLVAEFVSFLGRQPTSSEVMDMRRRATLITRPAKAHRSLAGMTVEWRQRAAPYIGGEHEAWVETLKDRNDLPLLRACDLGEPILSDAARSVTQTVAERRSVYSRANLLAEAHRILQGVRFTNPDERLAAAERVVNLAVAGSLDLSVPEICYTPQLLRRADGTSRLRPKGYEQYTTPELLEAESRLLDAGRRLDGPSVDLATVAGVTSQPMGGRGFRLSVDQALAVENIACSGRCLDVLVGPAGTGKSTAMAGLRNVWEAAHGPGSVIGLAPSAAAAEVLAEQLGIDCENTAKWLTELRRLPQRITKRNELAGRAQVYGTASLRLQRQLTDIQTDIERWRIRPGQLIIVDEATLAGTFALDYLVCAARDAGAKVLLTGDWAQLSGVEAGGAFSLLARDRGESLPQLCDVRRFTCEWERTASVQLRVGNQAAIDTYQAHDRVHEGSRDDMLDAAFLAWKADVDAGRSSLMIAGDTGTVTELNLRARADRVAAGVAVHFGLAVAGGQHAGEGDLVVTRQNERRFVAAGRWVKNGDRWRVTPTHDDGAMTVRRLDESTEITLPSLYVTRHVELAYATTAHRAQGCNTDTAHTVVSPATTREALYVAVTRGRDANHLYVDVTYDPDPPTGHDRTAPTRNAHQVLTGVLANEGADISAHEILRRAYDAAGSRATLQAEYQTIAALARSRHWDSLLSRSGLTPILLEQVRVSPARGALHAALHHAESLALDVETILPLFARNALDDAQDPAAILHGRVRKWIQFSDRSNRIAATAIPIPTSTITDQAVARALAERQHELDRRGQQSGEQIPQLPPRGDQLKSSPIGITSP
jgi:conjugative relaxase-like TrwC/TraI family protein